METKEYIFKENLAIYLVLCIFLVPWSIMWIGHDAFPFGNPGATGLFVLILFVFLMWGIVLWKSIKHKKRLIIDSSGIHYQNRRFTLSHNDKFWLDEYNSYPWDKITSFTFEWVLHSRSTSVLLVLEVGQKQPIYILVNELTGKRKDYIRAIEECSGGKCKFDSEKCKLSKKKYNKERLHYLIFSLIGGIAFFLLMIFAAK